MHWAKPPGIGSPNLPSAGAGNPFEGLFFVKGYVTTPGGICEDW